MFIRKKVFEAYIFASSLATSSLCNTVVPRRSYIRGGDSKLFFSLSPRACFRPRSLARNLPPAFAEQRRRDADSFARSPRYKFSHLAAARLGGGGLRTFTLALVPLFVRTYDIQTVSGFLSEETATSRILRNGRKKGGRKEKCTERTEIEEGKFFGE